MQINPISHARHVEVEQGTLRANKRETIDWLKFTLEVEGERTHGYAFTDTAFARYWVCRYCAHTTANPHGDSACAAYSRADSDPQAAEFVTAQHVGLKNMVD